MDTEDLKHQINNVIDQWAKPQLAEEVKVEEPRELPKDKRAVRTKSSGDRVYYVDEVKKTRQYVSDPEVLESLGFHMEDVVTIEDNEMLTYSQGAPITQVDEQS